MLILLKILSPVIYVPHSLPIVFQFRYNPGIHLEALDIDKMGRSFRLQKEAAF